MSEIPAELQPLADFIRARAVKIDEHKKLMESDQYREQVTRLSRLLKGAVEGLQTCWLMSTRSSALSDETLTFRFIDDAIFSLVGISSSISNGAHNPARREMRYLLESVCKHYHVDSSPRVGGRSLSDKLDDLKANVPRSSINFVEGQEFFALDNAKTKELRSDLKNIYSQSCKYVHRSKEQIDEYLAAVSRGSSPGFESVSEFRAMNREFARLCDVVIYLSLAALGPSGLAGDVFVHGLDEDKTWPYHKTKYCKVLSDYYNYKAERGSK
ncbi:MAG: hypothetical protein RBQ88_08610 [Desulfobulbus oligotrophicus]|jgi:hypothetical protein|nr:hypothetical protein [Desulfobulbus oligotrophicus]